jgi:hypothetical protein
MAFTATRLDGRALRSMVEDGSGLMTGRAEARRETTGETPSRRVETSEVGDIGIAAKRAPPGRAAAPEIVLEAVFTRPGNPR